jgi:cell division septal protein FtsQ
VAGAFLLWLAVSPFMPFEKIEITGVEIGDAKGLSQNEVLIASGLGEKSSYWLTSVATVANNIMSLSFVESATVERHFPRSLRIEVQTRKPVGLMLSYFEGKHIPLFVDLKGMVFEANFKPVGLPILSGPAIENLTAGTQLPEQLVKFFGNIEELRVSNPELLVPISEI